MATNIISSNIPDYHPEEDGVHKLVLTTNSVRNTTLASPDDKYYYEICTWFWHRNTTKINIHEHDTKLMRPVAEIEKLAAGRFKVRFKKNDQDFGDWISDIEFLKPDSDGVGGTFCDAEGVQYRWKTHNRKLQLVRADDEKKTPLVSYVPHRRYFFVLLISRHAAWELKPECMKMLDRLIVSYILVERRRRARHKVFQS
ncbi:hypothetical protein K435DRAFT_768797 [Dendrothele bispora CBS 962.96]|uniref:DUF6593 domain-containing protein n=1 Tax=Dendrothele bispora (strain CBS 962.96) TaxID=1314807 RepID=A0A4V4HBG8_DENBC|nr:hypothetical protein K435DRAFT_768797 [Dendrothele bispora CBS 962.96]